MARPMCVLPQPGGPWIEWKFGIFIKWGFEAVGLSMAKYLEWQKTVSLWHVSMTPIGCHWISSLMLVAKLMYSSNPAYAVCRWSQFSPLPEYSWDSEVMARNNSIENFYSAIAWCLIHWRITKAHININNVVFHWKCFLCEWFQHTVNMTIGLKIDVTLTHYEVLMKNRCYIVGVDDFDLNLKKVFREC